MSNNALLQQLSKCRELLLKKECIRIDFDNPDFLNNEDYINLTGISRDQSNTICTLVWKTQEKENIPIEMQ